MSDPNISLAALPLLADPHLGKTCCRCGAVTMRYHSGWDPAGIVCDDCWLEDAEEWYRMRREVEEQREADYWRTQP